METTNTELQTIIDNLIEESCKKFGKDFKTELVKIVALMKMMEAEKRSRRIPLAKWNDYYDYPTVGALRSYRHNNTDNFNEICCEPGGPNGGTIVIIEDKFFEWQRNRGKRN